MKGKDLATTLGIIYDKRTLIRNNVQNIPNEVSLKDKLTALENKFSDFASFLKGETINVEVIKEDGDSNNS